MLPSAVQRLEILEAASSLRIFTLRRMATHLSCSVTKVHRYLALYLEIGLIGCVRLARQGRSGHGAIFALTALGRQELALLRAGDKGADATRRDERSRPESSPR
jgi:hypothetical protein